MEFCKQGSLSLSLSLSVSLSLSLSLMAVCLTLSLRLSFVLSPSLPLSLSISLRLSPSISIYIYIEFYPSSSLCLFQSRWFLSLWHIRCVSCWLSLLSGSEWRIAKRTIPGIAGQESFFFLSLPFFPMDLGGAERRRLI